MIRALVLVQVLALSISLAASNAAAQVSGGCSVYAVSDSSGFAPVIPDRLLVDWRVAVPCLVEIIKGLDGSVRSPTLQSNVRTTFLTATSALRAISAKLDAEDEKRVKANKCQSGDKRQECNRDLDEFIRMFRRHDSLEVASVLAFGMRSDISDARLNALLILGNVIDNSTVCVPLVQVFDRSIEKEPHYVQGRANLLATISVVAPWAYKQNFDNIQRTRNFFWKSINTEDSNLKQTVAILQNIQSRLGVQTEKTNRSVNLPDAWRLNCKKYVESYVPKFANTDMVDY